MSDADLKRLLELLDLAASASTNRTIWEWSDRKQEARELVARIRGATVAP